MQLRDGSKLLRKVIDKVARTSYDFIATNYIFTLFLKFMHESLFPFEIKLQVNLTISKKHSLPKIIAICIYLYYI